MLKPIAAAAALFLLPLMPVQAGEAGDITRDALYAGDLAGGIDRLKPMLDARDPEAAFGTGFITFVQAVEGFAQSLYRHGAALPETPPLLGGGALAVPVPTNPNPEPLDYAKVRGILEALRDGLDAATGYLETAGASGDYVVPIDPLKVKIDANGDGTVEETESIERVFMAAFGISQPGMPITEPPPQREGGKDLSRDGADTDEQGAASESATIIGFDRADAIWLAGYSQVFAAQADFFLAHDFEDFVNSTFHRIFPRAGLPMQDFATGGMLMIDPSTDTSIADAVAGIHTLAWDVASPDTLKGVLERFRKITQLSRRNWEAILAETDDNRELIPNPGQTAIVPDGKVTDEVVAAWRETLDVADKVLNGELLVPHWRFRQGFDLKAYFETAERTDIVMLLTGYDAIPYLRAGPVATAESFAAANRVFGDQFLGYIFWFN